MANQHFSWNADALPEEVVGRAVAFLDPKSALQYAITAGPNVSRSIMKSYVWHLKRNRALLLGKEEAVEFLYRAFRATEDWRAAYDNPGLLAPHERALFDAMFNDVSVAIRFGQLEVVTHLVEKRGVDINEKVTNRGPRPLAMPLFFVAVRYLRLPVLEYLLGFELLDVNATISEIEASDGAVGGLTECSCLMHLIHLNATQSESEHLALMDVVSPLLSSSGIDVNAPEHNGYTPLHAASTLGGNAATLLLRQLLLCEGIDINATTIVGQTPLHLAVMKWREEEVIEENIKCLIEAGGDPQLRDADHNTPLDYATEEQGVLMEEWISNFNAAAPSS